MALSSVCGGRISDDMLIISFNVLWNGDEYAFTIHKNDQAVMVNECMTVRHDTFGSWIFTFHAIGEDASRDIPFKQNPTSRMLVGSCSE